MKPASFWLIVPALVSSALSLGCDEPITTKQPVGDNPDVASRPGIVQVGKSDDALIDEATACARFRSSLVAGAARLQCANIAVEECPQLVHPLVELPCVMYSEPSVAECERNFSSADECADLVPGSCVLTAILDPADSQGIPLACPERDSMNSTGLEPRDAGNGSSVDAGDPDASVEDGAVRGLDGTATDGISSASTVVDDVSASASSAANEPTSNETSE